MSEIQAIQTPQNQSASLAGTESKTGTELVCALDIRHTIAYWLNTGSRMSGDAHVRFCERLEVQFLRATHLVVLSDEKKYLEKLIPVIRTFLSDTLKLELHPDKLFIKSVASGVDFLGWIQFSTHSVLRATTRRRMLKRLGEHPSPETLASYHGLLKHGNARKLERRIDELVGDQRANK